MSKQTLITSRDDEVCHAVKLSSCKPQPIADQVARLKELLPGLANATYDETFSERPLPPNAEVWSAIPRFEAVAGNYNKAVEKVLDLIKRERKGNFYSEGAIDERHLKQTARAIRFWKQIGEEQTGHNILIVAAQFGLRHRGRSVLRTRMVFNDNEFGLGVFAVGVMILTYPDWPKRYYDLWIDCAGDEGAATHFHFLGGRIGFGTRWVGRDDGVDGSAFALPQ